MCVSLKTKTKTPNINGFSFFFFSFFFPRAMTEWNPLTSTHDPMPQHWVTTGDQ